MRGSSVLGAAFQEWRFISSVEVTACRLVRNCALSATRISVRVTRSRWIGGLFVSSRTQAGDTFPVAADAERSWRRIRFGTCGGGRMQIYRHTQH